MDTFMSMSGGDLKKLLLNADTEQRNELASLVDKLRNQHDSRPHFKHTFNMIISGRTGSGKT